MRCTYPVLSVLSMFLCGSGIPTTAAIELTSVTLNQPGGPDAHLAICFTTIESNRYVIESTTVDSGPPLWTGIPATETVGNGTEHCLELVQTNLVKVARLRLVSGFVRTIETEDLDGGMGIVVDATSISSLGPGDWARYDNLDLGGIDTIAFLLATTAPGKRIQLRMGSSTGTIVAELNADSTGGLGIFAMQSTGVLPTSGIHTLYLTSPDAGQIVIDRLVLRAEGPTVMIPGVYGFGLYGENAYGD